MDVKISKKSSLTTSTTVTRMKETIPNGIKLLLSLEHTPLVMQNLRILVTMDSGEILKIKVSSTTITSGISWHMVGDLNGLLEVIPIKISGSSLIALPMKKKVDK